MDIPNLNTKDKQLQIFFTQIVACLSVEWIYSTHKRNRSHWNSQSIDFTFIPRSQLLYSGKLNARSYQNSLHSTWCTLAVYSSQVRHDAYSVTSCRRRTFLCSALWIWFRNCLTDKWSSLFYFIYFYFLLIFLWWFF